MKYLKENWQELCIVSIAVFVIGTIMICTWKYSNYALYGRISTLESHTNTLAKMVQESHSNIMNLRDAVVAINKNSDTLLKMVQQEQYQLDVITQYISHKD